VLVDRPVYVPPDSVDFDVGLVDKPPVAWAVAAESGGAGQQRCEALNPSVHGDVIDLHAAFDQQLLHVAVGQVEA